MAIAYGKSDWQRLEKTVVVPRGAAAARLRISLRKTYGSLALDALSVAPLTLGVAEGRVARILLATDALGNLFSPHSEVKFRATVEARKPLPPADRLLLYSLRDYWGAEQLPPGEVPLEPKERKKGLFVYAAEVALPSVRLKVGKFYEFHAAVPWARVSRPPSSPASPSSRPPKRRGTRPRRCPSPSATGIAASAFTSALPTDWA